VTGFLLLDEEARRLTLRRGADGEFLLGDGTRLKWLGDGNIQVDGSVLTAEICRQGDDIWVHLNGRIWHLRWQPEVSYYAEDAKVETADNAIAPMPGSVVTVSVNAGDRVTAGQTMMVIESMKLETAIKAPRDGVVAGLHVGLGQTFERGAVLVTLAAEAR